MDRASAPITRITPRNSLNPWGRFEVHPVKTKATEVLLAPRHSHEAVRYGKSEQLMVGISLWSTCMAASVKIFYNIMVTVNTTYFNTTIALHCAHAMYWRVPSGSHMCPRSASPQERFLLLISVRVRVYTGATVRLEGSGALKRPVTWWAIWISAFRLVGKCLNRLG
jgi:hypothetical protein